MSERPKELASKASVAQVTEGSNPSATASERAPSQDGALSAYAQIALRGGPLVPDKGVNVTLAAGRQGPIGPWTHGRAAVAVNAKKIVLYALVVFVLYVIITDPAKAASYVQIGFEGISDAARAIGDFMTWAANGGKN